MSKNPVTGYGHFTFAENGNRALYTAHVASFKAHVGDTKGLDVLHKCDVRACFNPDHLFLGTASDNLKDMVSKGRRDYKATCARGERHGSRTMPHRILRGAGHPKAKLTDDDIRAIRCSRLSGEAIAKHYGVTGATISAILRKKTWKHV